MGSSSASASRRPSSSEAMIIARIFGWRSSAMNMCSVRQRPMPSAPSSRARTASSGVSAFVRTPRRRISSAHSSTRSKFGFTSASTSGTSSSVTQPLVPSIAIRSPSCTCVPSTVMSFCSRLMASAEAPTTAGRPMPRATSAACDALPPSEVRMPLAAWKPATSSASVKGRTRITSRPSSPAATASAAVNTTSPLAAPGEALTPLARISKSALGSKVGCRSASSDDGSIVAIASSFESRPSSTASHANRTAACAGRLALRVWSMNSCPSSTVNSVSCMSL